MYALVNRVLDQSFNNERNAVGALILFLMAASPSSVNAVVTQLDEEKIRIERRLSELTESANKTQGCLPKHP